MNEKTWFSTFLHDVELAEFRRYHPRMLHLQSTSSARWIAQVDQSLSDILIDHAHCEQKAASTAMDLMFDYVENEDLCQEMSEIVREELEHFELVQRLLIHRQIPLRPLAAPPTAPAWPAWCGAKNPNGCWTACSWPA